MSPRFDPCGIIYDLYVRGDERYVNSALSNDRLFVLQTEGTFRILPTNAFHERVTVMLPACFRWETHDGFLTVGGGKCTERRRLEMKTRPRKWRRSNTIALERTTPGRCSRAICGKTREKAQFGAFENKIRYRN